MANPADGGGDPGTQGGDPKARDVAPERPRTAGDASRPHGLLFLCVSNRARSQMAEGLAQALVARAGAGSRVRVMSAGSRPSAVHPLAIRALREIGIDIDGRRSKHVAEIDPATVDTVITLCAEEECPVFLGDAERLHWEHPDPDGSGPEEEQLARFRSVRESLQVRIEDWLRARGIGPAASVDGRERHARPASAG
jgi:arsenate reductase (thioredoxin)